MAAGEEAPVLVGNVGGPIAGRETVEAAGSVVGEVRLGVPEDGVVEGGAPRGVGPSGEQDLVAGFQDGVDLEHVGAGDREDGCGLGGGGGGTALLPVDEGVIKGLQPGARHKQDLGLDGIAAPNGELGRKRRVAGGTEGDRERARTREAGRPLEPLDVGAAVEHGIDGGGVKRAGDARRGAGGVVALVVVETGGEGPLGGEAAAGSAAAKRSAASSPETVGGTPARRRRAARRVRARAIRGPRREARRKSRRHTSRRHSRGGRGGTEERAGREGGRKQPPHPRPPGGPMRRPGAPLGGQQD